MIMEMEEPMPVLIRWLGDITGLNLKPTWEVEYCRMHTVKSMQQPDGTLKDTFVLYIAIGEKQYRNLIELYGKENLSLSIVGLNVIPLFPNAVLWTWNPPKGYEKRIKQGTYTALEIVPVEKDNE